MEAARAYDRAVLRLRGQDARSRSRMNFPLSEYNMDDLGPMPGADAGFLGLMGGLRSTPEPKPKKAQRKKYVLLTACLGARICVCSACREARWLGKTV